MGYFIQISSELRLQICSNSILIVCSKLHVNLYFKCNVLCSACWLYWWRQSWTYIMNVPESSLIAISQVLWHKGRYVILCQLSVLYTVSSSAVCCYLLSTQARPRRNIKLSSFPRVTAFWYQKWSFNTRRNIHLRRGKLREKRLERSTLIECL